MKKIVKDKVNFVNSKNTRLYMLKDLSFSLCLLCMTNLLSNLYHNISIVHKVFITLVLLHNILFVVPPLCWLQFRQHYWL